jgi:hypothetical protein
MKFLPVKSGRQRRAAIHTDRDAPPGSSTSTHQEDSRTPCCGAPSARRKALKLI